GSNGWLAVAAAGPPNPGGETADAGAEDAGAVAAGRAAGPVDAPPPEGALQLSRSRPASRIVQRRARLMAAPPLATRHPVDERCAIVAEAPRGEPRRRAPG